MPRQKPSPGKPSRRVFTREFQEEAVPMLLDSHSAQSIGERLTRFVAESFNILVETALRSKQMRNRHRYGACGALAIVLGLLLHTQACSDETPSPGNSDLPVTVGRLRGARLDYHRDDPKLRWSFGERAFVLEIGGPTVPVKLIEQLTGKRDPVARIEGTWTLDEERNLLVLRTVQADGQAIRNVAQLPISPAGLVRVDLGDYQYNVFPGEAELAEPQPKLAFKQDGKDLIVTMTIELVDAPYVVWTHAEQIMDHDPHLEGPRRDPRLERVELSYHVIQCRDDPALRHGRLRRKKQVAVVWRIADHRKAEAPYRVIEQFRPSADELTKLAPKLKKIAEQTRQRSPLDAP